MPGIKRKAPFPVQLYANKSEYRQIVNTTDHQVIAPKDNTNKTEADNQKTALACYSIYSQLTVSVNAIYTGWRFPRPQNPRGFADKAVSSAHFP
ncbi:MAG: hypothetical protein AB7S54_07560 [Bacteroidales bacterium]